MISGINIDEVWSYRPNPSDLYNIERTVNPKGGGGDRYIQIRKSQLGNLFQFLELADIPESKVELSVKSHYDPDRIDIIEFHPKSQGRMRIANQNRHWRTRAAGWSPAVGFPTLGPTETTDDAVRLFKLIGGLHIYLVRDVSGIVWAGYTKGAKPPPEEVDLPFVGMLYGTSDGGYWKYEEA